MTETHKNYRLIRYTVGWGFDGPVEAIHFIPTGKPKHNYKTPASIIPIQSWGVLKRSFKHEHNH